MKLGTKIVGITLAATALCGVGIGTASAATPAVTAPLSHSSVSGKADGSTTVVAYQASLGTLQSANLPAFACPSDQPWLVNMNLSQNRVVPRGVAVDEPGGIGVTILRATPGPGGRANGWTSGSATNWGSRNVVTVSAVCTNSAAAAYPA